jgi:hypothetical protein
MATRKAKKHKSDSFHAVVFTSVIQSHFRPNGLLAGIKLLMSLFSVSLMIEKLISYYLALLLQEGTLRLLVW